MSVNDSTWLDMIIIIKIKDVIAFYSIFIPENKFGLVLTVVYPVIN